MPASQGERGDRAVDRRTARPRPASGRSRRRGGRRGSPRQCSPQPRPSHLPAPRGIRTGRVPGPAPARRSAGASKSRGQPASSTTRHTDGWTPAEPQLDAPLQAQRRTPSSTDRPDRAHRRDTRQVDLELATPGQGLLGEERLELRAELTRGHPDDGAACPRTPTPGRGRDGAAPGGPPTRDAVRPTVVPAVALTSCSCARTMPCSPSPADGTAVVPATLRRATDRTRCVRRHSAGVARGDAPGAGAAATVRDRPMAGRPDGASVPACRHPTR